MNFNLKFSSYGIQKHFHIIIVLNPQTFAGTYSVIGLFLQLNTLGMDSKLTNHTPELILLMKSKGHANK